MDLKERNLSSYWDRGERVEGIGMGHYVEDMKGGKGQKEANEFYCCFRLLTNKWNQ